MGHIGQEGSLHAARILGVGTLAAQLFLSQHKWRDVAGYAEILDQPSLVVEVRNAADGKPQGTLLQGRVVVVMNGVEGFLVDNLLSQEC